MFPVLFLLAGCRPAPTETGAADSGTSPTTDSCAAVAGVAVTAIEGVSQSSMGLAETLTARLSGGVPTQVAFACQRADDPVETHLVEATGTDSASVDIAGLLADATYDCNVAAICPQSIGQPAKYTFHTPPLPTDLPAAHVSRATGATLAGGAYTLVNHSKVCNGDRERLIVYDPQGRVRWYDEIGYTDLDVGIEAEYAGGGHFFWGGGDSVHGRPEVDDLYAQPIYKANFENATDLVYTHDARYLDDGSRILSLHWVTDTDAAGDSWQGFGLTLNDPTDDSVLWKYSSQTGVDEGLLPTGYGGQDTWHGNATTIQQVDGRDVVYVSMYWTSWIVAIDTTDDHILWRFGPGGDFTLKAPDGTPLGDDEFMQGQHGLDVDGNKIVMYDNGYNRGYSRAVQYTLDTTTMTATEDWTWTEDNFYEPVLGDVDWLPNDHILVTEAHAECWSGTGRHDSVVEVDVPTQKPVWRLTYDDVQDGGYRAQRIDACDSFADAEYCVDTAAELARIRPMLGL